MTSSGTYAPRGKAAEILQQFVERMSRRATPLSLGWAGAMASRECARTLSRMLEAQGFHPPKRIA